MATRRDFLKSATLMGLAGCSGQVQQETTNEVPKAAGWPEPVIPGNVPPVVEPTGLKITRLETFTQDGWISVVRVKTDDGSEGYGQISTYDADLSAEVFHRKVAGYALGKDPADIANVVDRCVEGNYKFPWSYVCRAVSGLDTAVWDLLGKLQGKSVLELLGGGNPVVPVYGSSMSRTITPEEEGDRLRRLKEEKGFRAFKVRVGKVNGHDEDQWPGRTEELIPTIRRAVGDDVALLADGNSCYTPPRAIEVGRLMEDHGYVHFEEPCPYWELEWTAAVAEALEMAVAGGEQDNDLAHWRRMIGMRAVDIVQPDMLYLGGVVRTRRVAAMAAEKGLKCVPHSANLALVTLFTMHVFASISNRGDHVEFTIEDDAWTKGLFEPELKVVDGNVRIPDGPGWGIQITPEWLALADRQVSEV